MNEAKVFSELNTILNQLDENSIQKLPKKMLNEIEEKATEIVDYITLDVSFDELKLEEETKEMLAVISYYYLCSEEERQEYDKKLSENEKKYQQFLNKKYKTNDLFSSMKDENKQEAKKNETHLIPYKESFFKKVLTKIKELIKLLT